MRRVGSALAISTAVALCGGAAMAGGFALKEGSTSAQGASFAGATSGDADITYSFFNPAALRAVTDIQIAFSNSYISPSAELSTSAGVFDPGEDAFLGALYIGARVTDDLVLGLTVNSPFGLATEYEKGWFGEFEALRTELRTIAVTPMLSYDVTDEFSIGAGVTFLYGDLIFENAQVIPGPLVVNSELTGSGYGFGFVAGALWDVTPHITVGAAYKSDISFSGEGDLDWQGAGLPGGQIIYSDTEASADLPGVISFGVRFDVTDSFTMMAEAQWQLWSSLDVFVVNAPGLPESREDFRYEDAFFGAVGGEYEASEALTLRSGVALDFTPTIDDTRSPRIPDGDRMWISGGASYDVTERFTIDLAYSYLFKIDEDPIDIDPDGISATDNSETTSSDGEVHIISIGGSYEF